MPHFADNSSCQCSGHSGQFSGILALSIDLMSAANSWLLPVLSCLEGISLGRQAGMAPTSHCIYISIYSVSVYLSVSLYVAVAVFCIQGCL